MSRWEFFPFHGLGPLRFGMTPNDVRTALDEPELYEDWMGGNLNDSLLYRGLICGFDRYDAFGPLADAALTELLVFVPHRGEPLLWGRPLVEWSATSVRTHAASLSIPLETGPTGSLSSLALGIGWGFASNGLLERIDLWRVGG